VPRRFLFLGCSLLVPASAFAPACGPDPRPLECREPHPSFNVVISAPGEALLPPDTRISVAYGGSSVEEYQADMPGLRQVVFCEPSLPDGGALPQANSGGAAGEGGETQSSAGAAGDTSTGGGGEGGASGAAGKRVGPLLALRCELWTQGPATIQIEAASFAPVERKLRVSTSVCTVTETIELEPLDGGMP
jgi:hypothetical protein